MYNCSVTYECITIKLYGSDHATYTYVVNIYFYIRFTMQIDADLCHRSSTIQKSFLKLFPFFRRHLLEKLLQ